MWMAFAAARAQGQFPPRREPSTVTTPATDIREVQISPRDVPFEIWMKEGPRLEIPWNVEVRPSRLSISQRYIVRLGVSVDSKKLAAAGERHELLIAAGFQLKDGSWHPNRGMLAAHIDKVPPKNTRLEFVMQAFLLPGDYTVGIALADRRTGKRSVVQRRVRVSGMSGDPLRDSIRTLPAVDFIQSERALLRGEPMEIYSKLFLPVNTRRPIRVDVMANYTPSFEYAGRRVPQQMVTGLMTGMLRVFSQLDVKNGALNLMALDLGRRKIIFEQYDQRDFDFAGLRDGLSTLNTATVDVRDLQNRLEAGAFFRKTLAERLAEPRHDRSSGGDGAPSNGDEPVRVIVVLSTPVLFERHTDLAPLPVEGDCHCRVFHLRYRLGSQNLFDDLSRVMQRLRPTAYDVDSPEAFRRALAKILAEIERL